MFRLAINITLSMIVCAQVLADCGPLDNSHAKWTAVLEKHVSAGELDYRALKALDATALDTYLDELSSVCAQDYAAASTEEKIAFWINAYNAFTVALILKHYPIASIRKIGWLPGAAFRESFIPMPTLKGSDISLNDIEHGTLRSAFDEPRIHFALVCAARSCPPLRAEAYRGADLDRQLDDQAREFLQDADKNRYLAATNVLELSAIFDWFEEDFVAGAGTLPAFVGRYLTFQGDTPPAVRFLPYDWQLNDRAKRNSNAQ